ncbi:helix-turn-helix transcriptional regulator [Chryseobacterium mucoviscidosis]|uniref:helix-turn-helix transcriptional regulator n=1 Tax=Chryseobacterium mucoviscidosis TaxID=1945581 RepID=UPI0030161B46
MMKSFFRKKIFILFLYCISVHAMAGQKNIQKNADSLQKYSLGDLIRKSYSEKNPKIYCDEMAKRNLSDKDKMKYYRICGEKYYLEIMNNFDKSLQFIKISNFYAQKEEDFTMYANNLNMIALIYALQNKNDLALSCLKKKRMYESKDKSNIQELIFGGDEGLVYGVIGDFDKKIKGYIKAVKDLDDYLANQKKIAPEIFLEINRAKREKYNSIVDAYLLQKKLDSAAFYLKKIKSLPLSLSDLDSEGVRDSEIHYAILLGNLDDAIEKANKDLNEFRDDKITVFYDSYYLAQAYLLKKKYKTSLAYCEQALKSKQISFGFINYELELYKIAMQATDKMGDEKAYLKYSRLYEKANQKFDYNSKADFIAKLYNLDQIQPLEYELNHTKSFMSYLWIAVLVLGLLTAYLVHRFFTLKKYKKRFMEINAHLEKQIPAPIKDENNTKSNKNNLSDEKENEILDKLNKFEQKKQFLSPSMSLSVLSAQIGTNTNYLSSIIKKHKQSNFNSYLNQLRIDYIVMKLKQNPEYLNYKISYLAEECGFSSHTVFSRIFIEKMGIPPSKFIEYLKKERG